MLGFYVEKVAFEGFEGVEVGLDERAFGGQGGCVGRGRFKRYVFYFTDCLGAMGGQVLAEGGVLFG